MTATSHKSWCFTINNYTEEQVKIVKSLPCRRIIAYKEVASTGTPHIQGAVIFTRTMRLKAVKTALGGVAHLEPMRGSWAQQDYCAKEGRECIRIEDNSKQGTRTDLKRFYDDITKSLDEEEVASRNLSAYCKYQRAYKRMCFLRDKKSTRQFRKLEVIVLVGEGGKGKTRRAYEEGAFLWTPSKPEWWDGYDGENIICIDEFWGQIPITRMNRLLDGYQCRLPLKGGFTWAKWNKVYITSNVHVDNWYKDVPEKVRKALRRRITKIIDFF